MRVTVLFVILNFGFIYCTFSDMNSIASNANKICCDDAYRDDQESNSKCLTALQNGYKDSYIGEIILLSANTKERLAKENVLLSDPEYKDRFQGLDDEDIDELCDQLFKLPEVQAKVKDEAEKANQNSITTFQTKILRVCQYEISISDGITPEMYGFIISSSAGQFTRVGLTQFTEYLKSADEDKRKKIMDLTPSYWQKLYDNAWNVFEKITEYENVLLSDEFKNFNDYYNNLFPAQVESCKIEEVVGLYQKYKDKIKSGKEDDYKSDIETEIEQCAEAAKKVHAVMIAQDAKNAEAAKKSEAAMIVEEAEKAEAAIIVEKAKNAEAAIIAEKAKKAEATTEVVTST